MAQDLHVANVLMSSQAGVWQVPRNTYKQMNITLYELRLRVGTQGSLGSYLYEQMIDLNDRLEDSRGFPHGESWCLGTS